MADLEKAGVELVVEGADSFQSALGEIATGALRRLGEIAVDALGQAATAFSGFVSSSFEGALEAEQTMTRLGSVITSTGGAAGLTVEQAAALGTQFAYLAGGSDDAVLAIEEMGLRMGTVSATEMPQFIQTTLDLAAVTGVDATNAARLMAQAQEDPISALGRFNKMGIIFTDAQKEQIKTLQESGDTAGATALVMDRLAEATGGAALANSQTLAGMWETFKGTLSEAGESVMTALLPSLRTLFDTVITPALPIITEFGTMLAFAFQDVISGNLGQAIDDLGESSLIQILLPALGITGVQFYSLEGIIEGWRDKAAQAFADFMTAVQPVIDAATNLASAFMDSMPQIWNAVQTAFDAVKNIFDTYMPTILANVTTILNTLAEFWRAHGAEIIAIVTLAFEVIAGTVGATLTVISGIITAALQFISGVWTAATDLLQGNWQGAHDAIMLAAASAWRTIQSTFETVFNAILGLVGSDLDTLRATWQADLDNLILIVTTVGNNVQLAFATMMLNAIKAVQDAIGAFVAVGTSIINGLIQGITAAAEGVITAVVGAVTGAIDAAWLKIKGGSPSLVFAEIGKSIGEGLIMGINSTAANVADSISGLLDVGGSLSSIGGGFAAMFKQQTVDPLKNFVKATEGTISKLSKTLADSFGKDNQAGLAQLTGLSRAQLLDITANGMGPMALYNREQLAMALQISDAREQQAAATANLTEQEKHLLDIQKQQQDLAFLQEQVKLIDLIGAHGLDATQILGGMELGLNASLPGLIDAMTRAIQAIVAQTQAQLQIHSPSAVFADIGNEIMAGLSRGISGGMRSLTGTIGGATAAAIAGAQYAYSTSFNLNVNSSQPSQGVGADFAIMQSLAGV